MANKITIDDIDLMRDFLRLAGRADQRLRSLEKSGRTGSAAYRSAQKSISTFSEGKRFRANIPQGGRELRARYRQVEKFLREETSTIRGEKRVRERVGRSIEERYGLELTGDQISALFQGALWHKLNQKYGSDTAMKIVGALQRSEGDKKALYEDLARQNVFLSSSEKSLTTRYINQELRANGIDYLLLE